MDYIITRRVSFEVAHSQARRVDKSNAGGVSHRYANIKNLRPGEADTSAHVSALRGCEKIPAEAKLNGFLGQEFSRRVRQMNRAVAVLD